MTQTNATKYFVVGATDNKMKFVYLGFDSASGGYPYVSGVPRDLTSDIKQATEWLAGAEKNLKKLENPKIYEIILREVIIEKPLTERQKISNEISQLITPEFFDNFVKENSCAGYSSESPDKVLARMIRNLVENEK